MPSEPVADINLPAPWAAFLGGLDSLVPEPVALHCIGGFVLTVLYGVPRVTSDLDCVAILPHHDLATIAGRGSCQEAQGLFAVRRCKHNARRLRDTPNGALSWTVQKSSHLRFRSLRPDSVQT